MWEEEEELRVYGPRRDWNLEKQQILDDLRNDRIRKLNLRGECRN